jgi:hypothetical protein
MKYLVSNSALAVILSSLCHTFAASSNILVQDPSNDNSEECTCYLTSGPSESYFQHHRFWDFRSIPSDGANDFTLPPPSLDNTDDLINAPPTSVYLSTSDFVTNWSIQNWTADADITSPISRVNSAQNIYISRDSTSSQNTYLTLRATRLPTFMSIAELESNQKNLLHSSIRARMRIIPNSNSNSTQQTVSPGAVAGLFTYYSTHAESDIEILTRDPPSQIRYSNQPDYDPSTDTAITGASTKSTLPSPQKYTDWLDHRIDWLDGISRWYIDGDLVLEKQLNVPTQLSGLILNLWGDGGEWSGVMDVGAQALLAVEWIEMGFNISGTVEGPPPPPEESDKSSPKGPGGKDSKRSWKRESSHHHDDKGEICKVACYMDDVGVVGFPEVAFNTTTTPPNTTSGSPISSMLVTNQKRLTSSDVLFATIVFLSFLWAL